MKRNERNEFNYIKRTMPKATAPGATCTIRVSGGAEYKQELHKLFTERGFHPACICVDTHMFDDELRIQYIVTPDIPDWREFYTAEALEAFEKAVNLAEEDFLAWRDGVEAEAEAELTPEEELLQLLEEHEDEILEAGEKALLEALQNPWQQTGVDIMEDGRIVMWYDTAGSNWSDVSMTRIITFDGDRLGEPEEDGFEDRDEWAGWYAAEFGCSAALEQLKCLRERLEYDAAEREWLRQHTEY